MWIKVGVPCLWETAPADVPRAAIAFGAITRLHRYVKPCETTIETNVAQDDPPNTTDTHGRFLSFRHPEAPADEKELSHHTVSPNLTMDDASNYVLTHTPSAFQRMIATNYSYGFETDEKKLKANDRDHRKVGHEFCLSESGR